MIILLKYKQHKEVIMSIFGNPLIVNKSNYEYLDQKALLRAKGGISFIVDKNQVGSSPARAVIKATQKMFYDFGVDAVHAAFYFGQNKDRSIMDFVAVEANGAGHFPYQLNEKLGEGIEFVIVPIKDEMLRANVKLCALALSLENEHNYNYSKFVRAPLYGVGDSELSRINEIKERICEDLCKVFNISDDFESDICTSFVTRTIQVAALLTSLTEDQIRVLRNASPEDKEDLMDKISLHFDRTIDDSDSIFRATIAQFPLTTNCPMPALVYQTIVARPISPVISPVPGVKEHID